MRIDDDDFRLFGLAPRFAQDRAAIDARWKALQAEVHPDRFAAEGAAAQRVAMQWALRVNEAHQRLKDPMRRAAYLCELHGQPTGAESNTAMPAAFLMQQLRWREALEAATTPADLETLREQHAAERRALLAQLATLIDERQDWPAAAAQVRALMFAVRFAQDIEGQADRVASACRQRGQPSSRERTTSRKDADKRRS
jgi:molecular chaperone HscB